MELNRLLQQAPASLIANRDSLFQALVFPFPMLRQISPGTRGELRVKPLAYLRNIGELLNHPVDTFVQNRGALNQNHIHISSIEIVFDTATSAVGLHPIK